MQERHKNRACYFEEQLYTTTKYYIPYLYEHLGFIPPKILEVGCGEGGNLLPFAQRGCEVVGVDCSASRIQQAHSFFDERGQIGRFVVSDILLLEGYYHQFPLIIMHDVIEHVADKQALLAKLQEFLAPGGYLFIGFPAWQMPFGGHQQIARGKFLSHLPFIHLLPSFLYRLVLKLCREQESTIKELLSIKETQCTIEQFLKLVHQTKYKAFNQQFYFINPHYEVKFGLPPRKLNKIISYIPYLRNFFCTSCFYILKGEE